MGWIQRVAAAGGRFVTGILRVLDVVNGFRLTSRATPSQQERTRFDELERLVELRERGALSQKEFEARKARLRP